MGIQGLLPAIQPVLKAKHLSDFAGKRIAVDGYAWLHKGVYGCSHDLATGKDNKSWIKYCLKYIDLLLSHQIIVVMVFDGNNLPQKSETENIRAMKRQKSKEKGHDLLAKGQNNEARMQFTLSIDVTPRMAAELIQVLRIHRPNVMYLVSPYEADAQLAYLSINNHVDIILAEDSDTIPYGCREVIYKLDIQGHCQHLTLQDLFATQIPNFDLSGFTQDMLIATCIISGCDYLDSCKGMGLKSAYKHVHKNRNINKILRGMRLQGILPSIPAIQSSLLKQYQSYIKAALTPKITTSNKITHDTASNTIKTNHSSSNSRSESQQQSSQLSSFSLSLQTNALHLDSNNNSQELENIHDISHDSIESTDFTTNNQDMSPNPQLTSSTLQDTSTKNKRTLDQLHDTQSSDYSSATTTTTSTTTTSSSSRSGSSSHDITTYINDTDMELWKDIFYILTDGGPYTIPNNMLQYELLFYKALATFKHQTVYDFNQKKLVPLTPFICDPAVALLPKPTYMIPSHSNHTYTITTIPPLHVHTYTYETMKIGEDTHIYWDISFLGPIYCNNIAIGIAEGLVCPITKEPFHLPEYLEKDIFTTNSGKSKSNDKKSQHHQKHNKKDSTTPNKRMNTNTSSSNYNNSTGNSPNIDNGKMHAFSSFSITTKSQTAPTYSSSINASSVTATNTTLKIQDSAIIDTILAIKGHHNSSTPTTPTTATTTTTTVEEKVQDALLSHHINTNNTTVNNDKSHKYTYENKENVDPKVSKISTKQASDIISMKEPIFDFDNINDDEGDINKNSDIVNSDTIGQENKTNCSTTEWKITVTKPASTSHRTSLLTPISANSNHTNSKHSNSNTKGSTNRLLTTFYSKATSTQNTELPPSYQFKSLSTQNSNKTTSASIGSNNNNNKMKSSKLVTRDGKKLGDNSKASVTSNWKSLLSTASSNTTTGKTNMVSKTLFKQYQQQQQGQNMENEENIEETSYETSTPIIVMDDDDDDDDDDDGSQEHNHTDNHHHHHPSSTTTGSSSSSSALKTPIHNKYTKSTPRTEYTDLTTPTSSGTSGPYDRSLSPPEHNKDQVTALFDRFVFHT